MNPFYPCLEPLEPRIAPAGVIAVSVSAAGTLTLGTVAGQDGDEFITIDRLGNGSYQLTPGAGVSLRIGGNNFTSAQILNGINGLTANLGAGDDVIALSGAFFSKGVSVNLGTGTNVFVLADTAIGGNLLFTGGDGNDSVIFSGGECAVGGSTTIKLGVGTDLMSSGANRLALGKGLTVDGGAGNDTLSLATVDGSAARIIGNLKFIGGAGNDTLAIGAANATFSATGSVQFTDVSGDETVTMAGLRFHAGALLLQVGNGTNSLTTTATELFLARNFQWTSGTGFDDVNIGGTNFRVGTTLSIALGTGGGEATALTSSAYIGGSLTLSGSAAEGSSRRLDFIGTDISVGGKVTMTGGMGDGIVRLFANGSLFLGGGAALSAGGDTFVGISSNASFIANGSLSLKFAGGEGSLSLFAGFSGDVVINGAVTMEGSDSIDMTLGGIVTGPVKLATSAAAVNAPLISLSANGPDGVSLSSTVRISMPTQAGQTGTIRTNGGLFEGAVNILGGAGADTLQIDNADFEKGLTANLGAGADRFELEQGSTAGASFYHGTVLLQGGSGADVFLIGGNAAANAVEFKKAVTVDGGTGFDTVTVGTLASFAPGFPLSQKNIP